MAPLTPPEPVAELETVAETVAAPVAEVARFTDESVADDDELLLDSGTMIDEAVTGDPLGAPVEAARAGSLWLPAETVAAEPEVKATPGGGTLFERMSNIARGAAKVETVDEAKDPLDIPRFLNRQNNQ